MYNVHVHIAIGYYSFIIIFNFSTFQNNTSTAGKDTSAVAAFRFPTEFTHENIFTGNIGGGIMLLNTRMLAKGTLLFDSNKAMFGGGIMMDDRCLVCLHDFMHRLRIETAN